MSPKTGPIGGGLELRQQLKGVKHGSPNSDRLSPLPEGTETQELPTPPLTPEPPPEGWRLLLRHRRHLLLLRHHRRRRECRRYHYQKRSVIHYCSRRY